MERKRLGVLVSGRGSNLQALIDASKDENYPAEVVVVISNNPSAYAIERAKRENIPVFVIRREDYKSKKEYEEKIKEVLQNFKVDLVVLAGYMKIVGKTLLEAFPNRIINIHPSLLPSFPGLEAQRQAWEYGVKISGCTVHFVDEGIDSGPIIGQRAVPVYDDDTPATLAERILQEEHKLIVESVKKILTEDFEIIGRRVVFKKRG
ncbi:MULTISPECIES: phosphoribosylglycinamide formyltransferase [Dictyoglomus]|jgi:phosphoribosylglycinamide formyltransferase-1|uniref:Phosphoribosylglycinamide formyltransferase n=1 Tax=Dictyoglomus turgidum (strain DSM 6724 / Z-1310) TaxID=515635 RepID=B8E0V4_DICTD|nr:MULTISPECIES: phosphoribosylglycinamide formyltransferase [Dictyoglomus]ACK42691.1 phosphoribosylglycinamide formyltransferase [Dictyoglomus turgidum DSM 6724]PNV78816.1 MAG: phosphoribosylglycinamide formyltransferase [Dictyoglomus turgidum]HBU30750.1 phosphoribosylglycinamide formyltransferase [Dictyoglomus sp.]